MRRQDVFESFQILSAHLQARLTDKPQHFEASITYRHIPEVSAITVSWKKKDTMAKMLGMYL